MDRTNLLIASGLIGVIIVLVGIGILVFPNNIDSTVISNSTNQITEKDIIFDNSTPESTAISIARLNEGEPGFSRDNGITSNASLTSDRKYWIVKMHQRDNKGYNWIVTIDAKTLMSKKNGGMDQNINTWRSLDELKANYIAELQCDNGGYIGPGKPFKVSLDGKSIWKVPYSTDKQELAGYIYVDLATGKSKGFTTGTGRWSTLKELDDILNKRDMWGPTPFRDALRDLYPE